MEINNQSGALSHTEQHFCIANAQFGGGRGRTPADQVGGGHGLTLIKSSQRTKRPKEGGEEELEPEYKRSSSPLEVQALIYPLFERADEKKEKGKAESRLPSCDLRGVDSPGQRLAKTATRHLTHTHPNTLEEHMETLGPVPPPCLGPTPPPAQQALEEAANHSPPKVTLGDRDAREGKSSRVGRKT